jgi:hypothetical protein
LFVCCSSSPSAFVVRCCVVDLFAVVSAEEMSLRCGGGRGRVTFLKGLYVDMDRQQASVDL